MKLLGALLLAVAALVAAAAFWLPAPAATVNGQAISRQSLDADLSAVASSTGYQCYLGAQLELDGQGTGGLFPVSGAGPATGTGSPPTYSTTFVRYWLSGMEENLLVSQALAARHLSVSGSDLAVGRATLGQQITGVLGTFEDETGTSCGTSGGQLLSSLPAAFVAEQVRAEAERDVLAAHEAGYSLSPASLERYYRAHAAAFDTECISYVTFASEADADAALSTIDTGTSITQTGTVTQLGCGIEAAITYLPSSVTTLAVGKVSQPVSEGTGTKYALLVVTNRKPTPFAKAEATVREVLLADGTHRTTALLEAADRQARVTADPRYGRVVPGTIVLEAPASPRAAFVLDPTADVPPALRP